MGTVFRKTVTRPLPAGAKLFEKSRKPTADERGANPELPEVVERFARWKDKSGKLRSAPVTTGADGSARLLVESGTYFAKYRDGERIVRTVATGARTEAGARSVLADLERRAERVRSKIATAAEDSMIDHGAAPLAMQFRDYLTTLELEGTSATHRANVRRCLERVAAELGFNTLVELNADRLESWLASQGSARTGKGVSPRTRNIYRATWIAFGNWCVLKGRLAINPFSKVARADESGDTRRQRRSMTEDELRRLLFVARWRPLAEYGRQSVRTTPDDDQHAAKRSNWSYAPLTVDTLDDAVARARERLGGNPSFVVELERRGRERALVYKTLVLTGLRKGELAALTVGQLELDAEPPFVVLNAADEKNRQGSTLPIRSDLAADLREWLDDKAATRQDAARNAPTVRIESEVVEPRKRGTVRMSRRQGHSCQQATTLPANEPLFDIPAGLVRILDRDLQAAGIPKRDDRGRTLDVHALRHSFGTLLSKGGVSPRTAQAAMRHSTVDLTMNVYTDPRLLDLHAAVDALPELPLNWHESSREAATGTTGTNVHERVAPTVAPTTLNRGQFETIADKTAGIHSAQIEPARLAASSLPVKRNKPLSSADNGLRQERVKGFEPSTSSLGSCAGVVVTDNRQQLTTSPDSGCTNGCTNSTPVGANADLLAVVAALLRQLSPTDRDRLAELLGTRTESPLEGKELDR